MGVSDQLHASAYLSLENEPLIGIEKERWVGLDTWCTKYVMLLPGIKPNLDLRSFIGLSVSIIIHVF